MTAGTQTAAGASTTLVVGNSISTGAPPSALWSLIQQLQITMAILIIDSYTPDDVNFYLKGTSFALLNFKFIPTTKLPGVKTPLDSLKLKQPIRKLELLGYESRSTLFNNISFVLILGLVALLHLSLKVMACCSQKQSNPSKI